MMYKIPIPQPIINIASTSVNKKAVYEAFVKAYLRRNHSNMVLVKIDKRDAICERRN